MGVALDQARGGDAGQLSALLQLRDGARARVINLVNTFFYDRLTALPTIKDYMDRMAGTPH